jgi:hypothetical protein
MPTYDDEPEQQSDKNPAQSDQPSAQSDDATADTDQLTQRSDEQSAETSDQAADQSAEQSEEQPANSDQSTEQVEEQPSDTDQTTEPTAESDQAAGQPDEATGGGGGGGGGSGGGVGGGGPADDAVAAGKGTTRRLKVIAEFTQEGGDSFGGEILINLYVYNKSGYRARYNDGWSEWRDAGQAGNKISTDAPLPNLDLVEVGIVPSARAATIDTRTGSPRLFEAIKGDEFKFPIPSGGKSATLQTRFDVEVKPFETIVRGAPDPQKALEGLLAIPDYRYGVFNWKTEKIASQDFRFTGKYYTGVILSKLVK